MALQISVENYRGLSRAEWTLEPGVSLLVGPNGSGKTTLLDVPALLRDTVTRGTHSAVDEHGGPGTLVNLKANGAEHAQIVASLGDLRWQLQLRPRGAELGVTHLIALGDKQFVSNLTAYSIPRGAGVFATDNVVTVDNNAPFGWVNLDDPPRVSLASPSSSPSPEMKLVADQHPDKVNLALAPLRGYRLHGGYLIRVLRVNGSQASSDMELDRDGTNAFSVLRNWRDSRATRPRWDFVVTGLKTAFPDLFEELEFESAGQTVAARIFAPRMPQSIGAYFAPDGLLSGLLHLTAVASASAGGALAIDEFENALHPFAIRALLEHIRDWSSKHEVSVTLATHSPVLIDAFKAEPSRVLVMDPREAILPVPLDRMRDPEWLAHFSLGDLYARGDFGSQATG